MHTALPARRQLAIVQSGVSIYILLLIDRTAESVVFALVICQYEHSPLHVQCVCTVGTRSATGTCTSGDLWPS